MSEPRLEEKLEAAMTDGLGHAFYTIVRPVDVTTRTCDTIRKCAAA